MSDSQFRGYPDYSQPSWSSRPWFTLLVGLLMGFSSAMVPGIAKIKQLRSELQTTIAETSKEITELKQTVADRNKSVDNCHSVILGAVQGDGTKTILMDRNHPYGKFVPPGTALPAGYVPGPVWIIPRRVAPQTMDGTLNGVYAYEHPDGSLDGWYYTGGLR